MEKIVGQKHFEPWKKKNCTRLVAVYLNFVGKT